MQTTISNIDAMAPQLPAEAPILLREPVIADGGRIWAIAKDSKVLDANSSYAYLLWCRDFAGTSVVAEIDGELAGFITGYRRPQAPQTLFVWQVAVDHPFRGRGVAVAMLDALLERQARQGISAMETTVSPDNTASIAMFGSVARRRGARMTRSELFAPEVFPDGHEPEDLYRIAPITPQEEWR